MKFYKEILTEKELIMTKEIPVDEISIYSSLLKEKIKNELEDENDGETPFLAIYSEDMLIGYEAVREVVIRPVRTEKSNNPSVNELWF